ncbi:alpha/beta fold hydrolase [Parahaliea maris]|uniref:Alpha/beta fold hydrolase n=1 Tax=Parahaliea maris TaxID=2716870 RepID=A0A5C8ZWL3_9GAMM|nr:alpha/beta fold hydrolase [Parahaliea maris]TXS91992.1 alpha/beta fold hydrolase [Parahaliea maris]
MKKGYVDLPEGQVHYISAGQGPALLLFHQAPMSAEEWTDIIPVLSAHFTVIAPDMMGHGNSDTPDHEYEMADYAATVLRLMDALGVEDAVVCGNHSGGALATAITLAAPERVRKLIVSCEMLISAEQISTFLDGLKSKPLSRELPMDEPGQFLVDAWERYKALAPTADADTRFLPFVIGQKSRLRPYDAHFAVLRWMSEAEWIAQVECPTLVVGAEHDLFFNQALMETTPSRVPQGTFEVIRDAGALSTFEQPAAWSDAILRFALD